MAISPHFPKNYSEVTDPVTREQLVTLAYLRGKLNFLFDSVAEGRMEYQECLTLCKMAIENLITGEK